MHLTQRYSISLSSAIHGLEVEYVPTAAQNTADYHGSPARKLARLFAHSQDVPWYPTGGDSPKTCRERIAVKRYLNQMGDRCGYAVHTRYLVLLENGLLLYLSVVRFLISFLLCVLLAKPKPLTRTLQDTSQRLARSAS